MATEAVPSTINGTYHGHQPNPYPADPYNAPHAAANVPAAHYAAQQANAPAAAPSASDSKNDIPKDEVGWFFVEQYYTTLSRSPEKLHLFYSRKSQYVSGVEAEKVNVAVGQKAINERIRELDFHDCKVRVLNVDSQASFDNILVVVIGEISNRSEPPRKFVQTFVLAEQQNGYYVLNDIIRYLNEEDDEVVAEEAPVEKPVEKEATEEPQAVEQPADERQADTEAAAKEVDEKLENEVAVNGEAEKEEAAPAQAEEKTSVEQSQAPSRQSVAAAAPVPVIPATAEAVQAEKPKAPEPTPAAVTPAVAPTPVPEKPKVAAPKAPMSWAKRAAAAASGDAAAAQPAPAAAPVAAAPSAPVAQPAATVATPPSQPAAPAATESENVPTQTSPGSEWQTAGADHSRRQSRPQPSGQGDEKAQAYIKNVNEKVDASLLRQALTQFGKLKYFDVNRQRSCAFVEFESAAAYKAAAAANPHQIGTEQVTVEERRARPAAYSGNASYSSGRGGSGRGRGDRTGSQGRGGFQKESGRYTPRGGRGGTVTPKGRGQPQAA